MTTSIKEYNFPGSRIMVAKGVKSRETSFDGNREISADQKVFLIKLFGGVYLLTVDQLNEDLLLKAFSSREVSEDYCEVCDTKKETVEIAQEYSEDIFDFILNPDTDDLKVAYTAASRGRYCKDCLEDVINSIKLKLKTGDVSTYISINAI